MRNIVLVTFVATSLPALAAAAEPSDTSDVNAEPVVRYDKGLRFGRDDDAASLKVGGRIQGRYTAEREAPEPAGDEWTVPRLRASARGHVGPVRYGAQLAMEKGVELRDAYLDVTVVPDILRIRLGKWKMPGARHHLNSSGRLALVDRAITHKAFDHTRGIGVMAQNGVEGKQLFGWAVGVFLDDTNRLRFAERADGENLDRPYEPAIGARVGLNFGEAKVTDEVYWAAGPARAAIGAFAIESVDTRGDGDGRLRTGLDWIAGYGIVSVSGDAQVAIQQTATGAEYDGVGFHQQVAALLMGRLLPAVRFAVVDPTGTSARSELTAGLTIFAMQHRLKIGGDVSGIRSVDARATRARLQAQLVF